MDVGQSQNEIFELGIDLHRTARKLHLISERFEVPQSHVEDFDLMEPGPLHLPFEVSQHAAGVHEELVDLANQLFKASKLTMVDLEVAWEGRGDSKAKRDSRIELRVNRREEEEEEEEADYEDGEDDDLDGTQVIEVKRDEDGGASFHVVVT